MICPQNNIAKIRFVTALISLLISSIAFYSADIINRDGIFYMDMASTYNQGGLAGLLEFSHFGWPFFSIVVSHIHQITQLPFEISANVLNTLLFVLLTDTLVRLSNKILPNYRQVAVAALFFLCFLTLNHYRSFLGRDVGYWAFCTLALYQFILYIEKPTIQKATLWQVFIITAVLFRVDGIVILLCLPLYLFAIRPPIYALKQCLQLFYLLSIGILAAMLITIEQSSLSLIFSKIVNITKYINPDSVLEAFNHKKNLIETQILNKYSERYSALILSSGLMVMLLYKLIKALTLGYLGIYVYSWWGKTPLKTISYRSLVGYFLVLNIIILVGFMFTEYFVSKRYAVLAVISLLLLMLPRICDTVEKAWLSKHRPILVSVGLILFISLADSLVKSNSKLYIKDVAIWASNNLPEKSAVITNNKIIKYYFDSRQPTAKISLTPNIDTYQNYDYLIVIEKDKYKELKQQLTLMTIEPVFKLQNKRGNKATVYAINPTP
ncbi:MAG: hypothetical protein ACKE8R_06130 [Methylophagaceae bacterium]